MAQFTIKVNGRKHQIEAAEGTPLLWILREQLGLTGTKYGCGIAQCGICTVHVDGTPMKACTLPVDGVARGQSVTTIEGLADDGQHPLQKAWEDAQAPQCGYCQSGQIMQAAALLDKKPSPTREEIIDHMNPVLCRCGTYLRILKAIQMAAGEQLSMKQGG